MERSLNNEDIAGAGQKLEIISWIRDLADAEVFNLTFLAKGDDVRYLSISDLIDLFIVNFRMDDQDQQRLDFAWIGPRESEVLRIFGKRLRYIVDDVGTFGRNHQYYTHAGWNEVITSAKMCLEVLLMPK